MERNTLEKFFTGKSFVIPSYQRDYAWTQDNIDDLLSDIAETIETKTSHYIGTFILSRVAGDGYNVVDGQQRLTTLTMILNAVVDLLPAEQKIITRNTFIQDVGKKRWRLEPAEYNREFFAAMLDGKKPEAESKSQKLLNDAYVYIAAHVHELNKLNGGIDFYLDSLKQLEVMEFIESDEGKAIRIFQTVNDRGRPLAVVEKAKSLLIYYSNRFLGGEYDGLINESFGGIYRDFTQLKEIGEAVDTRVNLIAQVGFTEDSVMRYHFLAYDNDFYDFKPTTDYVLDGFLKRTLRQYQAKPEDLSVFIKHYVLDLRLFFRSFLRLVERVQTEPKFYKLLCILGLSTHLYPLAIRLQSRKLLDAIVDNAAGLAFADLVEIADVRIYKTRGTDPQKDISYLACSAADADAGTLRKTLGEIVRRFMEDAKFESYLISDMYSNAAALHILMEYGEAWAKAQGRPSYTVAELVKLRQSEPTIEHVFADTPGFNFPGRGFPNQEQYLLRNDRPGNLSVLEKEINSRCQNKTPEQKFEQVNLYKESQFDTTKALVAEVIASGVTFDAQRLDARTQEIAAFAKTRWPLWD